MYVPLPVLLNEIDQALAARASNEIDWVTIVGSGEPTLHSEIGELIRAIKCRTTMPVAVITNGALLYLSDVREALCAADAVLPTFSAGSAAVYRTLHRPHPETTFERLLEGLIAFRAGYRGNIWVEVMLVRGVNDSEEALRDIAAALQRVQPDRIDITLPERPPAEPWVESPDAEGLMRATAILGAAAHVVHPAEGTFDLRGYASPVEAILAIIARHPMRAEELERALARWAPDQVREALHTLESSGAAQVIERYGTRFWCAADAFYPSTASAPRKAVTTSYGCR